jgi:transposase
LGTTRLTLEAETVRVSCPEHGVVVTQVPWARHASAFTREFEDQTSWLATQCSKSAVAGLMRVAWRTVGSILTRVCGEVSSQRDQLADLKRIGIDEISYRKGSCFLTVVVDHDRQRLVWAGPGRDRATLDRFFEALGPERSARIRFVSGDGAPYIESALAQHCPRATFCLDPFHVVTWATNALDEIRREVWNEARRQGMTARAKGLKGARFALWKNPEKLTERQGQKLSEIARTNAKLYRAYLLKEQLRHLLQRSPSWGMQLLERWLAWACRSRLAPFVKLSKALRKRKAQIRVLLKYRLTQGLVESVNTRIRLIARRAFGFHSAEALIALAMLSLGGLCPALPGRQEDPPQ